VQSANQVLHLV